MRSFSCHTRVSSITKPIIMASRFGKNWETFALRSSQSGTCPLLIRDLAPHVVASLPAYYIPNYCLMSWETPSYYIQYLECQQLTHFNPKKITPPLEASRTRQKNTVIICATRISFALLAWPPWEDSMGSRVLSICPPEVSQQKSPWIFETDIPCLLQATKKKRCCFNGKKVGASSSHVYEAFTKVGGFRKENLTQQGTLGAWQL